MLAPVSASLFRYGACPLPITLERYLFSKITTTMWSGEAPPFGLFAAERCVVDFRLSGENGRSTAVSFCGFGCRAAPVLLGCASATVGGLLGCSGGAVGGALAAPQAPQAIVKTPMTVNPTR